MAPRFPAGVRPAALSHPWQYYAKIAVACFGVRGYYTAAGWSVPAGSGGARRQAAAAAEAPMPPPFLLEATGCGVAARCSRPHSAPAASRRGLPPGRHVLIRRRLAPAPAAPHMQLGAGMELFMISTGFYDK